MEMLRSLLAILFALLNIHLVLFWGQQQWRAQFSARGVCLGMSGPAVHALLGPPRHAAEGYLTPNGHSVCGEIYDGLSLSYVDGLVECITSDRVEYCGHQFQNAETARTWLLSHCESQSPICAYFDKVDELRDTVVMIRPDNIYIQKLHRTRGSRASEYE